MTPKWLAAATEPHRSTKALLALATAITLAIAIACSGDEPPPTDHPNGDPRRLKQTTATQHDTTAVPTDEIKKNDSQQANILVLHTATLIAAATGVIFLTLLDALSEDEGNPQPQTSQDGT